MQRKKKSIEAGHNENVRKLAIYYRARHIQNDKHLIINMKIKIRKIKIILNRMLCDSALLKSNFWSSFINHLRISD